MCTETWQKVLKYVYLCSDFSIRSLEVLINAMQVVIVFEELGTTFALVIRTANACFPLLSIFSPF